MAASRKFRPSPDQQPMVFMLPETSWSPRSELPDWRGRALALDLETRDDGLSADLGPGWPYHGRGWVAGVAAAVEGEALYAPVHPSPHEDGPAPSWDADAVRRWVADHIAAAPAVVMHNAHYDLGWLGTEWGIGLARDGQLQDTMCMASMIDENRPRDGYGLEAVAAWRGVPGKDDAGLRAAADAFGWHPKRDLWRLPARYVGPYAEADAAATLALWRSMAPVLETEGTTDAYRLEMDLVPTIVAMRRRGVRVSAERAEAAQRELYRRRDEALADLTDRLKIGRAVTVGDVNSPIWLERVHAAEGIAFPRTAKTDMGSFTKDWMADHEHWLPRLCHRASKYHDAAHKFLGQFILGYEHRGRLHAEVHQYRSDDGGTRSYRFSYSDPPLQQMPARDAELARIIRGCFLPEEGELWAACDYCHDEQTEVLTRRGWVPFPELLDADEVAQWDDGRVEFVVPESVYRGEARTRRMVSVRGEGQLDFSVTEDHGCLVYLPGTREHAVLPASRLQEVEDRGHYLNAGVLESWEDEDPDLLRLVVALQADGADRPEKYGDRDWAVLLRRSRKIERLRGILDRLGWTYEHKPDYKDGQDLFQVREDERLRRYLSPGKVFRLDALLGLCAELRAVFLDELGYWDGKRDESSGCVYYGSSRLENVDTVQLLAAITGRRATLHPWRMRSGKKPYAHVTVSLRAHTCITRGTRPTTSEKAGRVFCVTVPSGFFITRRNGHVIIHANSQQEYRLIVHFASVCKMAGAQAAVDAYLTDPDTDFHMLVVALTGLDRKPAKDTNFAKAFGAGVPKFASMINRTVEEARAIYEQYDREMPFVSRLSQFCEARAQKRGYLRLLDGARAHFNAWEPRWRDWRREKEAAARGLPLGACSREEARRRSEDPSHPWHGERVRRAWTHKSMNRLIQGSAARMTKLAMRACARAGLLPLIQMHDELGFSITEKRQVEAAVECMRDVVKLEIPIAVDAEVGVDWGRAAKVEKKNPDGSKEVVYGASWEEAVAERDRATSAA